MAGTSAFAAKKTLIDALKAYRDDPTSPFYPNPDEGHAGVQVEYGRDGDDTNRELIYGGRAYFTQDRPVSGGGQARLPRDENLFIELHVLVTKPGATAEEVEERAVAIGTVVEEWVAANPNLKLAGMVDGRQIVLAAITEGDLDGDKDDETRWALMTYRVLVRSRLR